MLQVQAEDQPRRDGASDAAQKQRAARTVAGDRHGTRTDLSLDLFGLALAETGRIDDDCRNAAGQLARTDPLLVRKAGQRVCGMLHGAHIGSMAPLATVFRVRRLYIHRR